MATFVQLSDADPAAEFATLLASLKFGGEGQEKERDAEAARLGALAEDLDYNGLIEGGLLASLPAVLGQHPNSIDTVFNLAFALLEQLDPGQAAALVPKVVEALVGDKRHPLLKLKLLNTFFNVVDARHGYVVFLALMNYAVENQLTRTLKGQLGKLDAWLASWEGVTQAQTAEIFFVAFNVARLNGETKAQQELLMKYFRSLETADAEVLSRAKPYAAQASLAAVKSDTVGESDLLMDLAAVKQLRADPVHARTFELLRIVATEPVTSYADFRAKNESFLDEAGIDNDRMMSKMRTLTLCSLGAATPVLPFAQLREALMLSSDADVEEAVIAAVLSGIIDAKIDQEKCTVHIQRTSMRNFRQEQWEELRNKLDAWRTNVTRVLEALSDAQGGDKM